MSRCHHCSRRLGLGTVSLGVFRRLRFCSQGCKRLHRATWAANLFAEPCEA